MRRFAGALIGILAYMSAAPAGPGDACSVAAHLVQADAALPRVAAAIKAKTLTIVVAGTGSSTLPGRERTRRRPIRRGSRRRCRRSCRVSTVKVISLAKPRQTAADMAAAFPKILKDEKPALVDLADRHRSTRCAASRRKVPGDARRGDQQAA